METPTWTVKQIAQQLRSLGVSAGDTLMVHASLRRIGPVVGGGAGLVQALQAVVGEAGTLFMTLGAADDWAWVNERAEDERAALLIDAVPFNALETPAQEDIGVLAEVFRTYPGTMVSDHPEGRMGANGARAAELLQPVAWNDYYGPGSPLQRFVDTGGRILRLGADLDTVTAIHYAEYLVPLEAKRRVRRHRMVSTDHGETELRVVECLDDSNGIVEWSGEDYFATITREYLASGRALEGVVGRATSELMDARQIVDFAVAWMSEHFGGP